MILRRSDMVPTGGGEKTEVSVKGKTRRLKRREKRKVGDRW